MVTDFRPFRYLAMYHPILATSSVCHYFGCLPLPVACPVTRLSLCASIMHCTCLSEGYIYLSLKALGHHVLPIPCHGDLLEPSSLRAQTSQFIPLSNLGCGLGIGPFHSQSALTCQFELPTLLVCKGPGLDLFLAVRACPDPHCPPSIWWSIHLDSAASLAEC